MNLLTQQLEQARIAEAKDLPVVQILDRAVQAERHARPSLRSNLMLAGIVSLVAGIALGIAATVAASREQRGRALAWTALVLSLAPVVVFDE